ncbi:MAG: 2-amino-4-hydroxy-6-hydroxymethyldihydropteridine diphosphokinase [Bacteroidota bacterium]
MESDLYLLLGSNLGDRMQNINNAMNLITGEIGSVVSSSACYETEPWGNRNQGLFLNLAILLKSAETPFSLLNKIKAIESRLGRLRDKGRNSPRTIDIDILIYGNIVVSSETLIIPHPRLHLRKFVLVPLSEINSELVHPVYHKTIAELMVTCTDNLGVNVYESINNFS